MRRISLAIALLLVLASTVAGQSYVVDYRTATWNSSTTAQATVAAADGAPGTLNLGTDRAGCAVIWMTPNGADITAGQIAFDVSFNKGASWTALSGSNGDQLWTQSDLSPHTTAFNGLEAGWRFPVHAFTKLRVRLQVAITGTSSITVYARSVQGDCAPFAITRQGDPTRLLGMPYSRVFSGTVPTAGADGTTAPIPADSYGVPFSRVDHPNRVTCFADNIGATLTEMSNCGIHAGLSLYITDVIAISTTATGAAGAIREGTGTNCATGTVGVIPVLSTARTFGYPANTAAPLVFQFKTPLRALPGYAICVIGTAVNTLNIMILGYYDK